MTLDEILKEIKVAQNIVILTHESPDGDAIGSSLAMRLMLKELEKECDVIIPEYSRLFDFLPGIETIKKESEIKNYDLAIAVDCADIKRIAKKEYFENAVVDKELMQKFESFKLPRFVSEYIVQQFIEEHGFEKGIIKIEEFLNNHYPKSTATDFLHYKIQNNDKN